MEYHDPHTVEGRILMQVKAQGAAILTKRSQPAAEQKKIRRVAHDLEARGRICLEKVRVEGTLRLVARPGENLFLDGPGETDVSPS